MPDETQPDGPNLVRRRPPAQGAVENYTPRPRRSEFDEYPSEEDVERFSGVTTPCPECRAELYDDVALCWNCGHAIGAKASQGDRMPFWMLAVAALAAIGLILAAVF